jgi:hypothetical protein
MWSLPDINRLTANAAAQAKNLKRTARRRPKKGTAVKSSGMGGVIEAWWGRLGTPAKRGPGSFV